MDAIEEVKTLVDIAWETEKTLASTIKLLKNRDAQITIALDALMDIASRGGVAGDIARSSINLMRSEYEKTSSGGV